MTKTFQIELKSTILNLPSKVKKENHIHPKYFIALSIVLVFLGVIADSLFVEEKYKGFIICLYLLSSLPMVTFFFLRIDIDTLNVFETYHLEGTIKFNTNELFINDEELSLDSIQLIKLDFKQHGNISWSIIDEQVKTNVIQNPHNVSIGGRNGYHFQKTYNSIIVYLKNGDVNRYSFFLDDITTKQTVQEFINFCYRNNLPFKEFTNGIRSYRMKNNLSYSEIQHIKKEHDLTSWV